jgi:hypothetical protein
MLTLTKTIIEKTMENKTEKKEVLDVDVNNNKIIE